MTNPTDPVIPTKFRGWEGLTKREYFSAMAMQGLCVNLAEENTIAAVVNDAVLMANALIAELNKEPSK